MVSLSLNMTFSMRAQSALSQNTAESIRSINRLSSGNRITRAGDDVSALAIATKLESRVSALRIANRNVEQATSMLQVMDGGLREIEIMLQRMNALAVQSSSGSLTANERGFLDQEFQNLSQEINRIATQTNFNGVNVLSGESSGIKAVDNLLSDTSFTDKANAKIVFTGNPNNNQRIRLQNVLFQFRNVANPNNILHVQLGNTYQQTAVNLVAKLNEYARLDPTVADQFDQYTYEVDNSGAITISSKTGGELGQFFRIDEQGSNSRASFYTASLNKVNNGGEGRWILSNDDMVGLGAGSVDVVGTAGSNMFVAQSQTSGEVLFTFDNIGSNPANNQRLRIDNGFNGLNQFQYRTNANVNNALHIQIGADAKETLENTVVKLTEWVETFGANLNTFGHRQLEFERDDLSLIMRYKGVGNATDMYYNGLEFTENVNNATPSAANMTNGTNTGLNTEGVMNADFIGTVSGFEATYLGNQRVQASITVGDHTYTATIDDTLFAAGNTRVLFESEEAGYFSVEIA